jgi:hypothetical protein
VNLQRTVRVVGALAVSGLLAAVGAGAAGAQRPGDVEVHLHHLAGDPAAEPVVYHRSSANARRTESGATP